MSSSLTSISDFQIFVIKLVELDSFSNSKQGKLKCQRAPGFCKQTFVEGDVKSSATTSTRGFKTISFLWIFFTRDKQNPLSAHMTPDDLNSLVTLR